MNTSLLSDELLQWVASTDEDEVDKLLTAALDAYEVASDAHSLQSAVTPTECGKDTASARDISSPVLHGIADDEVAKARAQGVHIKTQQDTKYCVGSMEGAYNKCHNPTTNSAEHF